MHACSNDRVMLDKALEEALRKMPNSGEVQVRARAGPRPPACRHGGAVHVCAA